MPAIKWIPSDYCFVFESGGINTRQKNDGVFIKVEMTIQNTVSWPLGTPDFTTNIHHVHYALSAPQITRSSEYDIGINGLGSVSINARNIYLTNAGVGYISGALVIGTVYYNNGYTTVTHDGNTYVSGQWFRATATTFTITGTGTVQRYWTLYDILKSADYSAQDIHVRISTKASAIDPYVIRYWGIVDPSSINVDVNHIDKVDRWNISFTITDALLQLQRKTSYEWSLAGIHNQEITPDEFYISVMADVTEVPIHAGRYRTGSSSNRTIIVKHPSGNTDSHYQVADMRFIKIVDIIEDIIEYIGYEAGINDNTGIPVTWLYYYNAGDSYATPQLVLTSTQISSLCVLSRFKEGAGWNGNGTFFDYGNEQNSAASYSWMLANSPYEVLQRILSSLGLVGKTKVNSSGERYLEISAYGSNLVTDSINDWNLATDIEIIPNEYATAGAQVTSPSTDTDLGVGAWNDSSAFKMDTTFTVANAAVRDWDFRDTVKENPQHDGAGAITVAMRPHNDFYTSLFALNILTGNRIYSICAIAPQDNGSGIPSGAEYPDWAYYESSVNRVIVPKAVPPAPYHGWAEVPCMALALYLWSPESPTDNPVGLHRPFGQKISLTKLEIDHSAVKEPPIVLTATINGTDETIIVTEVNEDPEDDSVSYSGYTREA